MDTLIHNNTSVLTRKDDTKCVLFVFLIGVWLVDNLTKWANDIALILTRQPDMFKTAFWGDTLSLNLIKILLTTTIIGLMAAIYAYLTRNRNYSRYLLLGLSIGLFAPILILVAIFYATFSRGYSFSQVINESGINWEFPITLLVVQAIAIAFAAKIGQNIGLDFNYLDDRDRTRHSIYGIRKFHWVLLLLPLNALISVGIAAVTRVIMVTIKQLIEGKYSGGIGGIMGAVMFPLFSLGIIWWVYSKGIDVVRSGLSKWKKIMLVTLYLVVIPTILLIFFGPR